MLRPRKKKGPVNAAKKAIWIDGLDFKSNLEVYMYRALKDAKIKAEYEKISFILLEKFDFKNECYEKQVNGKGDFIQRGKKKVQGISYKPDFTGQDFIIECKGRPNESFPLRWKLFKKLISDEYPNITLYKPQNKLDCDLVAINILIKQNDRK